MLASKIRQITEYDWNVANGHKGL